MTLERLGRKDRSLIGKMLQLEKMDWKDWVYVIAIIILLII